MTELEHPVRCPRCQQIPQTDMETHWERDCPPNGFDNELSVRLPAEAAESLDECYHSVGAGIRAALRAGIPADGDGSAPDTVTIATTRITDATLDAIQRAVEDEATDQYHTQSHVIRAAVRHHVRTLTQEGDA